MTSNGDWFAYCRQELMRLGSTARRYGDRIWPLAYVLGTLCVLYFRLRGGRKADDLACFGWHCIATRQSSNTIVAGHMRDHFHLNGHGHNPC